MTKEFTMAYIMREPCGCVVFVSADEPYMRKDNAREIAKGLRDGLTVERVTADWVREHGLQRCQTHEQMALKDA